jgi:PAS domain S-box-containing protein
LKNPTRRKKKMPGKASEKYKLLVETSLDMIFTVDLEGNFMFANKAFEKELGYSVEEIKKINGFELVHPKDLASVKEQFAKILEGKSVDNMEYRYKAKNGSYIHVLNSASPLFDSQGNVVAALGAARNITQRKGMEEELREARDKLQEKVGQRTQELLIANEQLTKKIIEHKKAEKRILIEKAYLDQFFESAQEGIVLVDKKGHVMRVNSEFTRMFGYSPDEISGRNIDEIVVPKGEMDKGISITKNVAKGKNFAAETVRQHKDGTLIDVSVLASPIIVNGEIVASYAIYRDVTERKKSERKLRSSLEEKEVLLREIHHRVKNNMQIVTSLLRLQARQMRSKKNKEILQVSLNRIATMALIHESLYKSKDLARINFSDYIKRLTTHIFSFHTPSVSGINLKINVGETYLDINRAIPCGLIINELVSNSIKHAFPDGKKGEISIGLEVDKTGRFVLKISDNGIGFSEKLDFDNTATLGIQLVRDLVEQIDGEIKLDRKGGTTYRITF